MRILFIDIDTLRPDHMGCYGYSRNTTPNMDQVCRDIFLSFAGSNTVLLELTPKKASLEEVFLELNDPAAPAEAALPLTAG